MARLPSPTVARPTPNTNAPVISDQSGQILAGAVQQFGAGLQGIATQKREAEQRFTYARAKSDLLNADIAARRSLENDPDWATYDERYREAMDKALENSSAMIRSTADRQLFEMESKLSIERGAADVRGASRAREVDWGNSELRARLNANRESALNANDEGTRTAIINDGMELIQGAMDEGYIGQEQAVKLRQDWAADYAEGYLTVQSPERRLEILSNWKDTPARFLTSDRRAELREAATKADDEIRVRRESQQKADAIMSSAKDRGAALEAAHKISDPKVRDATVARVNARWNEIDTVDQENKDRIFSDAAVTVEQTSSRDGINPDDWLKMTMNQRQAIEQRIGQLTAGVEPKTNYDIWYQLMNEAATNKAAFSRMNLYEFRPVLDDSNFEALTKAQMDIRQGQQSDLVTGYRTMNQVVEQSLDEMKIKTDDPRANLFREKVESAMRDLQSITGQKATTADVQKIVDDLMVKDSGGFFGGSTRMFELKQGEDFEVQDFEEIPQHWRDYFTDRIEEIGGDATDENILYTYNRMIRSARAR